MPSAAVQANGIVPPDGGKRKAEGRPSPTDARAPKKARTEAEVITAQPTVAAAPAGGSGGHQIGTAAAAAAAQGGAPPRRGWLLLPPEPLSTLAVRLGTEQRLLDGDVDGNSESDGIARCFEAAARKDAAGRLVAVLSCSAGGRRLWADELSGQPAAIAGTLHFAAAALLDGTLQV